MYYLSCLNDKFCDVYTKYKEECCQANTILENFSSIYGLDKEGSLQRNATNKGRWTFNFHGNNHTLQPVECEPHLKITQEDKNCKKQDIDHKTFEPRIYFAFPNPDVENGRIPVGSIGKHL